MSVQGQRTGVVAFVAALHVRTWLRRVVTVRHLDGLHASVLVLVPLGRLNRLRVRRVLRGGGDGRCRRRRRRGRRRRRAGGGARGGRRSRRRRRALGRRRVARRRGEPAAEHGGVLFCVWSAERKRETVLRKQQSGQAVCCVMDGRRARCLCKGVSERDRLLCVSVCVLCVRVRRGRTNYDALSPLSPFSLLAAPAPLSNTHTTRKNTRYKRDTLPFHASIDRSTSARRPLRIASERTGPNPLDEHPSDLCPLVARALPPSTHPSLPPRLHRPAPTRHSRAHH